MEENSSDEVINSKNVRKFPFSMVNVDEATEKRVSKHFKGYMGALLEISDEKWMMPKYYIEHAEDLYNFEARSDDIYIVTFIRSGTTLTQEMMWLLCNDLNYEGAKATKLDIRFPFFKMYATLPKGPPEGSILKHIAGMLPPPAPELLAEMKSPRLIKTHLPIKHMPYDALEKGCKIVYVARNPKDVIVSSYHFVRNPGYIYEGTFEEFVDIFMDNLIIWCPYFDHIKEGWSRRNDQNVLFLFYEDLVMDLKGSLKKLAAFLERPLSDSDLPELMNHLNIQNFKHNASVNMQHIKLDNVEWDFVRRGQVGGNPEMTPDIAKKIDEWTEQQLMGTDLKFPHQ